MKIQLKGLAQPIYAGESGMLTSFERAQVHPFIGDLCVEFEKNVIPMMEKAGQRKRSHRDLAARTFMQGALISLAMKEGGEVKRAEDGAIDPNTALGAMYLFVGGTMVRSGMYASVKQYAELWGDHG